MELLYSHNAINSENRKDSRGITAEDIIKEQEINRDSNIRQKLLNMYPDLHDKVFVIFSCDDMFCWVKFNTREIRCYNIGKPLPKTTDITIEDVLNDRSRFPYLDAKLQTMEICKKVLSENGYYLKYIDASLKNEYELYELYIIAVVNAGKAIKYVPEDSQTKSLCELAISSQADAIKYIKRQTMELCEKAVRKDSFAITYINCELSYDELKKLWYYVLTKHGFMYKYAPLIIRQNEQLKEIAISTVSDINKIKDYFE